MQIHRRHFFKIIAGSLATSILGACGRDRYGIASTEPAAGSTSESSNSTVNDEVIIPSNKNYYVDVNRGNDAGVGSPDDPWKTLRKASNSVRSGDTVYIRGGDYRAEKNIYIEKKGTEGAPIKFVAYEQEQPIISGFDIVNSQWIEISNVRIIGPKTLPTKWRDMPEIVVDDPSVGAIDPTQPWSSGRKERVFRKYATFTTLIERWVNQWSQGIGIRSSYHILIKDNEISHHTAGINGLDESANLIVESNRLHHLMTGFFTGYDRTRYDYGVKDSVISNNHMFQNLSGGVRVINNAINNVVENNVVEFSGIGHIGTHTGSTNNIIRNNQLTYGGYYSETMENPGSSGISIHSSGPGNRVEGNYIAYQYDITLRDGNGVIVDLTPTGAVVANNVIYRNMGNGVTSTASGNNTIVHNTIIENGYNTTSKWNGVGIGMAHKEDTNNVIANNILYNNYKGGMYFGGLLNQQKYVDHNLIHSPDGLPLVSDDWNEGNAYLDLSSYQTTGFGTHSLVAEPMFLNFDQGDYRLHKNSPAINSGTAEYTTPHDFENRSRLDDSLPDLGAFVYQP